jgi:ABC-type spermidine/putrescine transport system permease subunit II
MSVVAETAREHTPVAAPAPQKKRRREGDRPRFLYAVMALVTLFMFLPIVIVIVYSFNSSKSLSTFDGFSFRWYEKAFGDGGLRSSLSVSVEIAAIATLFSAVVGTMLAFGLERGRRAVARANEAALIVRLLSPETATAVALLLMFTQIGIPLSRTTIVLGHIALCVPFVTVVVRSRLAGLNPEVEEAAMDLGASRVGALRLVALPLLWPAIAAASMLAFVLSFDDFITTLFTSGNGVAPLPLRIYSALRFGVTPVVNAIGVLMLVIALLAAGGAALLMRLARRRSSPSPSKEMTP